MIAYKGELKKMVKNGKKMVKKGQNALHFWLLKKLIKMTDIKGISEKNTQKTQKTQILGD